MESSRYSWHGRAAATILAAWHLCAWLGQASAQDAGRPSLALFQDHTLSQTATLCLRGGRSARRLALDQELRDSASRGDVAEVRRLIGCGAKASARGLDGLTTVHIAALKGHVDVIEALFDLNARLDALSTQNTTALQLAAAAGELKSLATLARLGASLSPITGASADASAPAPTPEARRFITRLKAARLAFDRPDTFVVNPVHANMAPPKIDAEVPAGPAPGARRTCSRVCRGGAAAAMRRRCGVGLSVARRGARSRPSRMRRRGRTRTWRPRRRGGPRVVGSTRATRATSAPTDAPRWACHPAPPSQAATRHPPALPRAPRYRCGEGADVALVWAQVWDLAMESDGVSDETRAKMPRCRPRPGGAGLPGARSRLSRPILQMAGRV